MTTTPTQTTTTPPTPTTPPPPRGALLVVFLTVFIDLLGFGIVLPVLPRQATPYLDAIGMPPLEGGAGGAVIGVLFAVFSLMQFIFSPIWGRLSDRIGRRPILLLSLSGSVVFYALYGYAVSLPVEPAPTRTAALTALGLILLARVGAGIAGASVGTAAAVIADCTTPENRARGMALIGIAFGGGFTLGPLIAYFGLAVFDQARWGVGAIASLLSGVALLIAIFVFRETRRPGAGAAKEFPSVSRSLAVLQTPTVGGLVLVYFLTIFAMASFESTLALFTKAAFAMGDDANFLVFAAIGFVLMLTGGITLLLKAEASSGARPVEGCNGGVVLLAGLVQVAGKHLPMSGQLRLVGHHVVLQGQHPGLARLGPLHANAAGALVAEGGVDWQVGVVNHLLEQLRDELGLNDVQLASQLGGALNGGAL